ncbi:MAG: hypothetical protein A2583_02290 [Bdellovibrionales bacterium RIFOXYD1_FULL_53_11]|nr:MAG: hypothetical protein A2583_02290 [Bdellovibrionales bacterium RIFOXYD1_FULL_53_11]
MSDEMFQSGGAKGRGPKRVKPGFHLRRVAAEIIPSPPTPGAKPVKVNSVLNELSPKGIGIFCTECLRIGQEFEITIYDITEQKFKCRIASCNEHNPNTHVLAISKLGYKAVLEFIFADKAEEEKAQKYYDDMIASISEKKAA